MPEAPKVKLIRQIIVGLVCLLFLLSPVFSFAATTQLELLMSSFPPPSNLTATVVGYYQINLNWSAVSIAVSYKVYRDGILIASPVTTAYSDTSAGIVPGTIYSYAVSAINADGAESQSSFVSATTPSQGGGMPLDVRNPSVVYKKSVGKLIVEEIQRKLVEIAKRISDLRKQINQLFQKKAVVEAPKIPEEKISPEKAPPEQILPPVGEFLKKEKARTEPINLLKEYRKWFWQKISNFWQKIWPF